MLTGDLAAAQVAPSLAINYCAYETLRSHWLSYCPDRQSPTVTMSLLCGSFAGLISSTATFPLDLARRRMQACPRPALATRLACSIPFPRISHSNAPLLRTAYTHARSRLSLLATCSNFC